MGNTDGNKDTLPAALTRMEEGGVMDGAASPTTTSSNIPSAGCYLWYGGDGEAMDAAAGCMTRNEFVSFQAQQVDPAIETFIEKIRDAILRHNDQGQFLTHGISPSVLTDDWVLRATGFLKCLSGNETYDGSSYSDAPKRVKVVVVTKTKGFYVERWMMIKTFVNGSYDRSALPLLMYTRRNDPVIESFIQHLMNELHPILTHVLRPYSPLCQVSPLPWSVVEDEDDPALSQHLASPYRCCNEGSELGEALQRVRALRERGATKAEMMAEKKRVRAQRGQQQPQQQRDEHSHHKDKEEDTSGMSDVVVLSNLENKKGRQRDIRRDSVVWYIVEWCFCNRNSSTIPKVWKAMLIAMVVYYLYAWMRTA